MREILKVENLTVQYGGLIALKGISFSVKEGEFLGIIGPNGAGKTTLFNAITGMTRITQGDIFFKGQRITGFPPHRIAQLGIARTFQNLRLFPDLSVLDNVRVALGVPYSFLHPILLPPSFRKKERELTRKALYLLHLMELGAYRDRPASALPYGERKRLEIARAMALNPCLLLLDEPTAGLSGREARSLMEELRDLKKKHNLTIMLIEHNMMVVMDFCERIIAISYGEIIGEGTPREISNSPAVIEAYLGEVGDRPREDRPPSEDQAIHA